MHRVTELFEQQRPRLLSLAYQMLGEIQAAEDIVQEAWFRWDKTNTSEIDSPRAWLSSIVTRLSIDQLRSARHRRETYTGPWLPEPIIEVADGPSKALELAQQCELALLWSMERLQAEERAAFLLRQVFDVDYVEIAKMLETNEQNCRQLVSRSKKKLAEVTPRIETSSDELEQAMQNFAEAIISGDQAQVIRLLAPDAVALADGGGLVSATLIPVQGAKRIAAVLTHLAKNNSVLDEMELTRVNGRPAFSRLVGDDGDMIFTVRQNAQGRICWIYILRNPNKLAVSRAQTSLPH